MACNFHLVFQVFPTAECLHGNAGQHSEEADCLNGNMENYVLKEKKKKKQPYFCTCYYKPQRFVLPQTAQTESYQHSVTAKHTDSQGARESSKGRQFCVSNWATAGGSGY